MTIESLYIGSSQFKLCIFQFNSDFQYKSATVLWVHVQQTSNGDALVPLTTWNYVIVFKSLWFYILTIVSKLLSRNGVKLFKEKLGYPWRYLSIYISIYLYQQSGYYSLNCRMDFYISRETLFEIKFDCDCLFHI
jgi:hypothetical protein